MNLINTRESQFELLRIVAIFMVLIHHSLAVADTFGYTGHYTLNEGITGVLLNSACNYWSKFVCVDYGMVWCVG